MRIAPHALRQTTRPGRPDACVRKRHPGRLQASLWLKGAHSLADVLGGLALAFLSHDLILRVVSTQPNCWRIRATSEMNTITWGGEGSTSGPFPPPAALISLDVQGWHPWSFRSHVLGSIHRQPSTGSGSAFLMRFVSRWQARRTIQPEDPRSGASFGRAANLLRRTRGHALWCSWGPGCLC